MNALNGGKTGLHLAANEGFAHIIEILLKHSPDLEVRVSKDLFCVFLRYIRR